MSEQGQDKQESKDTPKDELERLRLMSNKYEQLFKDEQLLRKNQVAALNKINRELAEKAAKLEKAVEDVRESRRPTDPYDQVVKVYGVALENAKKNYLIQLENEIQIRTTELKENQLLLKTIIDSSLSHIQVFKAVRDENKEVTDFIWVMTNKGFSDANGDMTGKQLLAQNPAVIQTGIFADMKKVLESGIPKVKERFYSHEQFNGWFNQSLVKMDDGIIMTTDDITPRKETELELEENRNLLQATLDSSLEMVQVFKAIRNEQGKIVDFTWLLNNHAAEQLYGNVIGQSLLQNNPGVLKAGILDKFIEVTENGIPQQYERHYIFEQFNGWFYQSVVKLKDGVATSTADITGRKTTELHLAESRDRLQSILDTTLVQMSILEALRDEQGIITDLEIKAVNHELEKETGRKDLVGKYYAKEYPGIKTTGLFDLIVKAIDTGEPQATEYFYPYEGFNKWFSCMFVKLDDGVVATNMDITARKQAEEERFKNYLLLKQSEDLAALGSWDYNLTSKTFTWSDGMYRLFDLEYGKEIEPEIYLQYTTEGGRPSAERVVQHIREGRTDFEETLEMLVSGKVKILHLKAAVVRNDQGRTERVLGVDMDITAMRTAEETIRRMEDERQLEIFQVTLRTQEEERRRISESLHNGLGQMLYGVKMSLSQLSAKRAAENPQAYEISRRYTSDLLSDAIRDSRRISHELMPAVLEKFGLKAAVKDVCQQMQDGVRFTCFVDVNDDRIDKYMQLAIFRTLQELMLNVVKHAGATEAAAEIRLEDGNILLRVSDNGRGINTYKQEKDSIGLASIRSKVGLLTGSVDITSAPGKGTSIVIRLPYQQNKLN